MWESKIEIQNRKLKSKIQKLGWDIGVLGVGWVAVTKSQKCNMGMKEWSKSNFLEILTKNIFLDAKKKKNDFRFWDFSKISEILRFCSRFVRFVFKIFEILKIFKKNQKCWRFSDFFFFCWDFQDIFSRNFEIFQIFQKIYIFNPIKLKNKGNMWKKRRNSFAHT